MARSSRHVGLSVAAWAEGAILVVAIWPPAFVRAGSLSLDPKRDRRGHGRHCRASV